MNEKQFLKNFKKHCEIARDLGIYSKVAMIKSLKYRKCPFIFRNLIQGIDYFEADVKRNKLLQSFNYYPTADHYETSKTKPVSKMLSILKSIPWRI